jgi:WD40 repeat protein
MPQAHPDKLKVAREISRRDILLSLARVPRSQRVFAGSSDFNVYDIDLAQEKPEPREMAGHGSYVTGVALAGMQLVSGGYDGKLIWWDLESRQAVRTLEAHSRWIRRVQASPDGKTIASVADDMVARLWEAETGRLLNELRGHKAETPHHYPSMLYTCAFSADGRHLATADRVGHVVVWETATGRQIATVEAPEMYTWDPTQRRHSIGGVRSLAFSPDGQLLAVGGMGQVGNIDHLEGKARVEIFDWQKGERTHEFPGDKVKGLVQQLAFHPAGPWLVSAGGDGGGFVTFIDLETKKVLREEKAPMHVHGLAMSEEGDTLYTAGHGKLVVWNVG